MKPEFSMNSRFLVFLSVSVLFCLSLLATCAGTPEERGQSGAALGRKILKTARSQLGNKYCFGGRSPEKGFDCSGLAWWSHKINGIRIPRQSWDQFRYGKKISDKDLKAGDLLYFETYKKGASHVGVYDGEGGFIHSPSSGKKVRVTAVTNSYYRKRYLGARRFW